MLLVTWLPVSVGTTFQVSSDLGMTSDLCPESHQFGITGKHGLVLHHGVLEETVQHHVTQQHLQGKR